MGSVIVNPNTNVASVDFVAVGAGDIASALSDVSDATYTTDTGTTAYAKGFAVQFSAALLPDGAAIASVTPKIRASQAVTSSVTDGLTVTTSLYKVDGTVASKPAIANIMPKAAITDITGPVLGAFNGPTYDDSARFVAERVRVTVSTQTPTSTAANDHRVYKVTATIEYVEAPVASSLAIVSGDLTTSTRPRHTYTYTSPSAIPQYEIQAATWLVSDLASYPGGQAQFELEPEAPFRDALGIGKPSFGSKSAYAWTLNSDTGLLGWQRTTATGWTPAQDLPNTGAMKTYFRVAGTYAGERLYKRDSLSSVAFTMAAPAPPTPTSITPVWQYPGATAPNQNSLYRTKVDVAYPVATLGAWSGRRLQVEHLIDDGSGRTDWQILPLGTKEIGATAGTATFYDTLASPNRSMKYRARSIFWSSAITNTVSGAYVTQATNTPTPFDNFVLRNPLDETSTVVLRIQGDLSEDVLEYVGQSRGLGAPYPTFISDVIGGKVWPIQALTPDEATWTAFKALRALRSTLVFQQDMDGHVSWVRFGEKVSPKLLRSISRRTATTRARLVDFELVETFAILGQPQSWS